MYSNAALVGGLGASRPLTCVTDDATTHGVTITREQYYYVEQYYYTVLYQSLLWGV